MQSELQIFPDKVLLAKTAADLILKIAQDAIRQRGKFTIALSGGHTPEKLYALLSEPPFRSQIPWDNVFVFWGDERCVPKDDLRNNGYNAQRLLISNVSIPAHNVFPIYCNGSPENEAIRYEKIIVDFFGSSLPCFDLILLGLGKNGHTASLFPGTEVLYDEKRLVAEVCVPEQRTYRVTMTARLINEAANIVFLVTGNSKAVILEQTLHGTHQPEKIPAQLIRPMHGKLFWFIDDAAASAFLKTNNV